MFFISGVCALIYVNLPNIYMAHAVIILYPVIALVALVSFDIFNKRLLYCTGLMSSRQI